MGAENKSILPRFLAQKLQDYKALDRKGKQVWWGDFFVRNAIYIIILILVIYAQYYSISRGFSNTFLSMRSIINIVRLTGSSLFLALGVGGIIVLTGTDLSAGRIMGLTACIAASLLQRPVADFSAKMFPNFDAPPIIIVKKFTAVPKPIIYKIPH